MEIVQRKTLEHSNEWTLSLVKRAAGQSGNTAEPGALLIVSLLLGHEAGWDHGLKGRC